MESKIISHGNKRETYEQFVDKFKPKKTTDDCYTPPEVYEAVKEWAINKFGIPQDAEIIRPFWPGGDYRQAEYPEGCVVIDNPPFSILKEICNYYKERGIKYVLFCLDVNQKLFKRHVLCEGTDHIRERGKHPDSIHT